MTVFRGQDGATLVVPAEAEMPPGAVAAWVDAALGRLPEPAGLRAAVVTLDLVAGSRARQAAPYVIQLSAIDQCRTLVVSVDDCTPAHESCAPDAGLVLVAGLSSRWGVEQRRRGRTTWAQLAMDGDIRILAPDQPVPRLLEQRPRSRRTW